MEDHCYLCRRTREEIAQLPAQAIPELPDLIEAARLDRSNKILGATESRRREIAELETEFRAAYRRLSELLSALPDTAKPPQVSTVTTSRNAFCQLIPEADGIRPANRTPVG